MLARLQHSIPTGTTLNVRSLWQATVSGVTRAVIGLWGMSSLKTRLCRKKIRDLCAKVPRERMDIEWLGVGCQ